MPSSPKEWPLLWYFVEKAISVCLFFLHFLLTCWVIYNNRYRKSSFESDWQTCKVIDPSRPCCPCVGNQADPRQPGSCRRKTETAVFIERRRKDARPVATDTTPKCSDALATDNMTTFFVERRTSSTSVFLFVAVLCASFVSQGECETTPRKLHI